MKWLKKGQELDAYVNTFDNNKCCNIYVFGYGRLGTILADTLNNNNMLAGIIDNDETKQNKIIYGNKIISLQEYLKEGRERDSYIVIATIGDNQYVVEQVLKEKGLVHGKNYFYHDGFLHRILPIFMTYKKNKAFIPFVQISLTERCTLKCKKCAHACYAVGKNTEDLPLSDVYKSADFLFAKCDYIQEFMLIGGEPFLYKQISEVIEYTGSKYDCKMSVLSITTNGTIIPSNEILELCKKYNVLIRISNYSKELPQLKKQYQKVRIEQGYVRVYDEQDVEGIVKYLMDHKIVPNEIKKNKVGLEEYYIELMSQKEDC